MSLFSETLLTGFYEGSNSTNGKCSLKELTHICGFKLQICISRPKPHSGPACFRHVPNSQTRWYKILLLLCPELPLHICLSWCCHLVVTMGTSWPCWLSPTRSFLLWRINGLCPELAPPPQFTFLLSSSSWVNYTQAVLYMCTASYISFFLLPLLVTSKKSPFLLFSCVPIYFLYLWSFQNLVMANKNADKASNASVSRKRKSGSLNRNSL